MAYKMERGDGVRSVNYRSPKAKGKDRDDKAKGSKVSPSPECGEHMSMSVRPISNGFIVSRSHSKGDGDYTHEETYHPKRPKMDMPAPPRMSKDKD